MFGNKNISTHTIAIQSETRIGEGGLSSIRHARHDPRVSSFLSANRVEGIGHTWTDVDLVYCCSVSNNPTRPQLAKKKTREKRKRQRYATTTPFIECIPIRGPLRIQTASINKKGRHPREKNKQFAVHAKNKNQNRT
mmetsp:Transcript_24948/g.58109  ORF Transcript_24948/g.58109 Transcript_24948/m.58109 type:complete len:137 (-) Transcript_24948:163-573(-)